MERPPIRMEMVALALTLAVGQEIPWTWERKQYQTMVSNVLAVRWDARRRKDKLFSSFSVLPLPLPLANVFLPFLLEGLFSESSVRGRRKGERGKESGKRKTTA